MLRKEAFYVIICFGVLMEVFRCPGIVGSTMVNTPCLDCLRQILVILQHEAVQRTQLTKKANTNAGLED